jgi:hypothetical protein
LTLVALRGNYGYSLYGLVYGMLNRQEAALRVVLHPQRGYGLYELPASWLYVVYQPTAGQGVAVKYFDGPSTMLVEV